MPIKTLVRNALVVAILIVTGTAQAHTGHGTSGIYEGLIHPFGADHLLAMVAVGIWSVFALPEKKAWAGPATFMLFLVLSALLGFAGVTVPHLESLISASVVLFGAMLMLSKAPLPTPVGLGLIAAAASLHGLAHGAETPEAGFAAYAFGFLLTTASLHFGGVLTGLSIFRYFSNHKFWLLRALGIGCSGAGMYLLSQI